MFPLKLGYHCCFVVSECNICIWVDIWDLGNCDAWWLVLDKNVTMFIVVMHKYLAGATVTLLYVNMLVCLSPWIIGFSIALAISSVPVLVLVFVSAVMVLWFFHYSLFCFFAFSRSLDILMDARLIWLSVMVLLMVKRTTFSCLFISPLGILLNKNMHILILS